MRYIIYCDESEDKGRFYSNFYGGALLRSSDRDMIGGALSAVKEEHGLKGEAKWTKISAYNERAYCAFVSKTFELMAAGLLKIRVMFTQNIHQIRHVEEYRENNEFFMLYYQFIKHAFGLTYCNPDRRSRVHVTVYLDDAPDSADELDNFKNYLSSLSTFPFFHKAGIVIPKEDIAEVDSSKHVILQAVDVILGSIQFRLNELHREKPEGSKRRGKRTLAKERVYKHINTKIRGLYPNFNIGMSTGQAEGPASRWIHPYRHWLFVPTLSVLDTTRGKKKK